MKKGWEYKTLGEVCTFINGFAFKSSKFTKEGSPIIRISDIQNGMVDDTNVVYFDINSYSENLSKYKVYPNDILIAMSGGTTGKTGINYTNKEFYLNQRVGVFREDKSVLNHMFLFYYLQTKGTESLVIAAGAAQPNLSTAQIKNFILPIPPLSEQKEIVEYLDSSFAKIDKLKENAAKNLEEAKALFQSALKDALEPKEGWEEKTLPDISENLDSRRIPITKGKRESGKYPYYGASGIVDYVGDYIFDEDILLLSEDGANLLARSTPIAFSVSGKVWVNNHAHILKFKDMCTQRFVEYFFASKDISEYVTGAAQPKLSQKKMNIIPISIPSLQEQQSIVSFLDSLNEKVNTLQQNYSRISNECDALKQTILRQVFE